MIVFLEVTPRWPAASDPILACSAADRRAQTWDTKKWAAAVFDPGSLAVVLFNGDIGSEVQSSTAPVVLSEKHLLKLYPDAKTVRWEGASFRMWAGDFTTPAGVGSYPYANTVELVSKGKVSRFEKDGGAIKLSLDPAGEAGETNVLSLEYAGTGGAEGGPDLKGKLKPWLFGHAMSVEPVLINEDDSVYQFSAYGAIQAVDALYERGADFGAPTANYANYAALVAATIPAGRWATCLAEGLIRLGAPQYGVITGDVRGDYAGSVQRRHPGAILQRIATYRGIAADAVDSASLAALDAYAATLPAGGFINLKLDEQTTFLDLARRLASGFNAQAGFNLLGELIVTRVGIGTPEFTLHSQGKRLPLVNSFTEGDTPPPFKRIRMSGNISWRVHDLSNDIAFYATPLERGIYDPVEMYREGNIVSIADGSRWIYSNPVPSVGNMPSDASLFWSRLSSAVTSVPGADGVSNAVVFLYKRGATSPAAPTGTFTYTYATGALSGGTLNGWTQAVPAADGNPLWVIAATASASAPTDSIAAAEFSSPVIKDGAGLNAATVFLYQRSATAPAVPATTLTYTFSTAVLAGTLGSWSQSAPAHDGNPLYMITATAVGAGATDTIATGEWATPRVIAANGANGLDGNDGIDGDDGKLVEFVWQRAASLPATPTGNGIPAGWSDDPPSGADPLWMSKAKQELTGVLVSGESWSVPIRHDGPAGANGTNGANGANGLNNAVVYLYQRSATSPAAPSGTFTYTFTTGVLSGGTPGSWSQIIPAANGDPLWVIAATASASTATDSIPAAEFTSPILKDGAGLNAATVFLYQRAASAPTAPGSTTTYTFSTGVLAGTLGSWTQTVPAFSANPLYVITATALAAGATDTIASGEWSAVRIMAENGADGSPGVSPVSAVAVPASKQFTADSDGTIKAGQLPFNVAIDGFKAGATIGGTVTINGTPSGCTATAISGGFTIDTVVADTGFVPWRFTATDGQVVDGKMSFSRNKDPASGGSVLIGFSSTSWWGSGSYGATGPSTVLPASSTGKLAISGFANFYCSGNGEARLTAKLQYRAVGSGTWIDSGFTSGPSIAIKTPDFPGEPGENTPGEVFPSGTLTGLTANGSYEVQMVGSRNASYNAIAAATGSVSLRQVA